MNARVLVIVSLMIGMVAGCTPPASETGGSGLENGSFMVNLDGRDIHYEVHGQGPVVMTVPNSWGLSLEGLRAMYRGLEDRLTFVYFDPRGMGESGPVGEDSDMGMAAVRADFDALRNHLGLDRVHAIGWSNGAANLILLAAEHPDHLSSAIFLHGMASFDAQAMQEYAERYPELMQRYEEFQTAIADESLSTEEQTAMLRRFWLEVAFPMNCADRDAAPALMEQLFGDAEFSWPHAEYANLEFVDFDARERLASIPTRSLVVAGAHDTLTVDTVRAIHDGLTDSEFVVFESSGHHAPVEQPERFESVLLEFLGVER
jgi:pimeloyl-ACP methyl ester carboxylesterase